MPTAPVGPCAKLFHQGSSEIRSSVVDICGRRAGHEGEHRGQYQGARWTRHKDTGANVLTGWDDEDRRIKPGEE